RFDKADQVVDGSGAWQPLLQFGTRNEPREICLSHSLAAQKLKEGSQRGQLSRDRALLALLFVKPRYEFPDHDVIDPADIKLRAISFRVLWALKITELIQIAQVIAQCVLGHTPFVFQVVTKSGYVFLQHSSVWDSGSEPACIR